MRCEAPSSSRRFHTVSSSVLHSPVSKNLERTSHRGLSIDSRKFSIFYLILENSHSSTQVLGKMLKDLTPRNSWTQLQRKILIDTKTGRLCRCYFHVICSDGVLHTSTCRSYKSSCSVINIRKCSFCTQTETGLERRRVSVRFGVPLAEHAVLMKASSSFLLHLPPPLRRQSDGRWSTRVLMVLLPRLMVSNPRVLVCDKMR